MTETNEQASAFTSLTALPTSQDYKAIIDLGKKLVTELKIESSNDTLSRWMAHFLAEKITAAEAQAGETHQEIQIECCNEILKLWSHRETLPKGMRPFQSYDAFYATLKYLEPSSSYFRYFQPPGHGEKSSPEAKPYLDQAMEIDETAQWLIADRLAKVANLIQDQENSWIELANQSELLGGEDVDRIKQVTESSKSFERANARLHQSRRNSMREKLISLAKFATERALDIEKELALNENDDNLE